MHSGPILDSRPDATAPPRNQHVLVIDGNDATGNHSRALLEVAGYAVTVTDMPDIGVIRRVEPDVVVFGLMYRGEPIGIEFLERHAADPMTAQIPVVIHAAIADLTHVQRDRLSALPHAVVAMTSPDAELLAEIERALAQNA
jgi:CheY-like chemotaxis protein